MIQSPTTNDPDAAWRQQWIATIQERARREVPRWLVAESTRTLPLPASTAVTSVTPLPETGPMLLRETVMISAVKLLPIKVRETHELVSSAIRQFYHTHARGLPAKMRLHPLRCLGLQSADFFAVNCEDIGCYTLPIECDAQLDSDAVQLLWKRWPWQEEEQWESYLFPLAEGDQGNE